ncbi:hypothetical protein Dimus_037580 [Dionaea muscipula]
MPTTARIFMKIITARLGPGRRQLNKNNHSDDDDDDDDEEEEKETPCSCRHIAKIPFDSSSILHAMPLPLPRDAGGTGRTS